ncbi:hypothetical protein PAEPH01_0775 [Pancytospora epiphaga]|nr:hypothetical protein PAEPH01_0775 [Pancytospora epiphaga]
MNEKEPIEENTFDYSERGNFEHGPDIPSVYGRRKSRNGDSENAENNCGYDKEVIPYQEGRESYPQYYMNGGSVRGYADTFHMMDTKPRNRTSPKQLDVLERVSQTILKPDKALRQRLSAELGMTQRQVQIWFQNRRAKIKKMREPEIAMKQIYVNNPRMLQKKPMYAKSELYDTLNTPGDEYCHNDGYKDYNNSMMRMNEMYYKQMGYRYPNYYGQLEKPMPKMPVEYQMPAGHYPPPPPNDMQYMYYADMADPGMQNVYRDEYNQSEYEKEKYYGNAYCQDHLHQQDSQYRK